LVAGQTTVGRYGLSVVCQSASHDAANRFKEWWISWKVGLPTEAQAEAKKPASAEGYDGQPSPES
jgi:hypothetical protein